MNLKKKPHLYMLGIDGAVRDFIREHAESGEYPNFKRLLDSGCLFTNCMTAYPSITPTCWATISTGTPPVVHGAVDQEVRLPGGDPNQFCTAYDSFKIHAERYWETVVRKGGKALVMDMPTSGPAKMDGVFQFSSFPSCTAPQKIQMDKIRSGHMGDVGERYTIPGQYYTVSDKDIAEADVRGDIRFQTPSGPWQPMDLRLVAETVSPNETNSYVLPCVYTGMFKDCLVAPFTWLVTMGEDGVCISFDGCDEPFAIKKGEWTPYFERELPTEDGEKIRYTFRIKLLDFDFENRRFSLHVPLAVPKRLYAWPPAFGKEVEELSFVAGGHQATGFIVRAVPDIDSYIELETMDAESHRLLIEHTLTHYPIDVVVDYLGFPDGINHAFKSYLDEVQKTSPMMMEKTRELFFRGYKVLDDHLGWIFDNIIDEETTLFVVGDHGAIGFDTVIWPHDILEQAGLLTWLPGGSRANPLVDWSKTKAYPMFSGHVFVNLKGRDPHGIVEPEDYQTVVDEVIIALQEGLRDKGKPALAFAVENKQAGFIGEGGPYAGDVVYGLTGSRIGGAIGGVHACQIPSACTEVADIRALCVMKGPKFRKGVVLDRPMDQTDIAPTVMYAAGYPQPKDATGGIIFQAIEEENSPFVF